MSNQEDNLPDIEFSEDDVQRLAEYDKVSEGWHRFVDTNTSREIRGEKKRYMVKAAAAPLEDPEDLSTFTIPTVRHDLMIPLKNPEVPEIDAPNTSSFFEAYFAAVDPQDCRSPYKKETGGKICWRAPVQRGQLPNGKPRYLSDEGFVKLEDEVILDGADNIKKARLVAKLVLTERMKYLWNNPQWREGRSYYGRVEHKDGFANISEVKAELPKGAKLEEKIRAKRGEGDVKPDDKKTKVEQKKKEPAAKRRD